MHHPQLYKAYQKNEKIANKRVYLTLAPLQTELRSHPARGKYQTPVQSPKTAALPQVPPR